jgi:hypothetical protein
MNATCTVCRRHSNSSSLHLHSTQVNSSLPRAIQPHQAVHSSSTTAGCTAWKAGPTNWHGVQGTKPINQCPEKHCCLPPKAEGAAAHAAPDCSTGRYQSTSRLLLQPCTTRRCKYLLLKKRISLPPQPLHSQNIHCYKLLTDKPAQGPVTAVPG